MGSLGCGEEAAAAAGEGKEEGGGGGLYAGAEAGRGGWRRGQGKGGG